MSRVYRFYRRWLPAALGLTVVANLAISPFVPPSSQPIRFHERGTLTHLVHFDQETVARRFSLYLELGDVARDGILILPPDSPISAHIADGLSGVTVVVENYDPESIPREALPEGPPIGDFSTPHGDVPYWILPGPDTRWWLALTAEGIVVVPESRHPLPGAEP